MPTIGKPEPHALTRLRERFGVEMTPADLRSLALRLADPTTRSDTRRFRFVLREPWGAMLWLVRLTDTEYRVTWAPIVYDPERKRVITALPWPVGLPPETAERVLIANHRPKERRRA